MLGNPCKKMCIRDSYVAGATNRFVTITGNVFLKNDIAENMSGLQWLLETHMKRKVPKTQKAQQEVHKSYLSDERCV